MPVQTKLAKSQTPPAAKLPKLKRTRERFPAEVLEVERFFASSLLSVAYALLTLATGTKRSRKTDEGEIEYYDQPPDYRACEAILTRVMGKWERAEEPASHGRDGKGRGRTNSLLVLLKELNAGGGHEHQYVPCRREIIEAEAVECKDPNAG